jgi:hypothetical protein
VYENGGVSFEYQKSNSGPVRARVSDVSAAHATDYAYYKKL